MTPEELQLSLLTYSVVQKRSGRINLQQEKQLNASKPSRACRSGVKTPKLQTKTPYRRSENIFFNFSFPLGKYLTQIVHTLTM
jgi:hypothetical protein